MTADDLIVGQYAGRPHLRATFDAITSPQDVDPEVRYLLAQAYLENS